MRKMESKITNENDDREYSNRGKMKKFSKGVEREMRRGVKLLLLAEA